MSGNKTVPTMKDVAREAGVALGTVSKVVNGIPVGEEYRLRVEAAIEKLNYRVSSYARGLRSSKTYTIAVMVPNLISPFFSRLVDCINRELSARKYRMLFYATDYDPAQEQELVHLAEQQKVDGIICLSYNPHLQVSPDVPLVSIDRYFGAQIPCVASDNYGGGRLAAKLTNEPNKRKDGFIAACEALEVPYTLKIVDDYTPYAAFEEFLMEHFGDGRRDFDGIFCVTDSLAHQIRISLQGMNVRVPEDVQIIGFDGVRHFGDLELTCSTIVQPLEAIAANCVELVLSPRGENAPALICLPVSYGWGGTTRE